MTRRHDKGGARLDERSRKPHKRRALFLDRDGVINVDTGYVGTREAFVWQSGIFDLVQLAHKLQMLAIVVTNQSGIARGLFTEEDFQALTTWMCTEFANKGAPLARVYHCPFHEEARVERYKEDHPWRKPHPGMLLAARDDLDLDMGNSVMIGDQWRDAIAANTAGVGHIALIGEPEGIRPEGLTISKIPDLVEAKTWLAKIVQFW